MRSKETTGQIESGDLTEQAFGQEQDCPKHHKANDDIADIADASEYFWQKDQQKGADECPGKGAQTSDNHHGKHKDGLGEVEVIGRNVAGRVGPQGTCDACKES